MGTEVLLLIDGVVDDDNDDVVVVDCGGVAGGSGLALAARWVVLYKSSSIDG